jgi:hypothetical protein
VTQGAVYEVEQGKIIVLYQRVSCREGNITGQDEGAQLYLFQEGVPYKVNNSKANTSHQQEYQNDDKPRYLEADAYFHP